MNGDAGLPRENVYGHTAKVRFFLGEIDAIRQARGRSLRVLDLGCGNGWAVTRHLAHHGDHVLGIDLHEPSIAYANANFASSSLEFRCTLIESMLSDRLQCDVIVLADVLEHLDDPESILRACLGLLAPQGVILVALPNGFGPFEIECALSRIRLVGPALLRCVDLGVAVLNKFVFRGLWTRAMQEVPADLPYNGDSPHVQFRSLRGWQRTFEMAGCRVQVRRNLSFLAGPFSNYLFGASRRFCTANVRVAGCLPGAVVSGWVFRLSART